MTETSVDAAEFYKTRIENFHVERDLFSKYVSMIQPNKGELHVLDWEYRAGIDNASSAIKEREQISLDLQRLTRDIISKKQELVALKSAQESRIVQIQRLSELSQPVQRDTTYVVKDRYAGRAAMNMYSGVTITNGHIDIDSLSDTDVSDAEHGTGSGKKHAKQAGGKKHGASHETSGRNAIKSLRTGEVMMLETRLEEETRKLSSSIEELELSLKEVSVGSKALDKVVTKSLDICRDEAANLIKQVDRLDHQGFLSVSELLALRLRIMVAQREEIEELAQLRSDKEFFKSREMQMREQLISDMNLMKRRLKTDAANSTKDFHAQALGLNEILVVLRKKLNKLETEIEIANKCGGLDDAAKKLQEKVNFSKERYQRLETRTRLEMEGYNNEAAQLRKKFSLLEAKYEKLKM